MADTVTVRKAHPADFPKISAILRVINADFGEHIYRLLYETCENIWQVAENGKGEMIACDRLLLVRLPTTTIIFGTLLAVQVEYKNRGVFRMFAKASIGYSTMGRPTPEFIGKSSAHQKFSFKAFRYAGKPTMDDLDRWFSCQQTDGVRVLPIFSDQDLEQLIAYDRSIFDIDRVKFMRRWAHWSKSGEPYARTFIAKSPDGAFVGFGVLRLFSSTYEIQPVYADNDAAAKNLLYELTRFYVTECGDKPLRVYFNTNNRVMMEFVRRLKMEHLNSHMIAYSQGADVIEKYIQYDKIYSTLYHFPA